MERVNSEIRPDSPERDGQNALVSAPPPRVGQLAVSASALCARIRVYRLGFLEGLGLMCLLSGRVQLPHAVGLILKVKRCMAQCELKQLVHNQRMPM